MKKLLDSKKGNSLLISQGILLVAVIAILIISGGDPEKAKALFEAIREPLMLITGIGATAIAGQSIVDIGKGKLEAKNGEEVKKPS